MSTCGALEVLPARGLGLHVSKSRNQPRTAWCPQYSCVASERPIEIEIKQKDTPMAPTLTSSSLIFQLGTNNWQRQGEFAPGSGILHAAHHDCLNNALPNTKSFSVYPSKNQKQEALDAKEQVAPPQNQPAPLERAIELAIAPATMRSRGHLCLALSHSSASSPSTTTSRSANRYRPSRRTAGTRWARPSSMRTGRGSPPSASPTLTR